MHRPTSSAIVGFATLLAFVVFLGFTFAIRGSLFGAAMEISVLFERISGLEVGSPVYVAGVYAGEVTSISYQPRHAGKPVVVSLRLNKAFTFYRNARVRIVQAGFIGDRRLEIDPGSDEHPELPYGEAIEGETQFDIDRSMRQAQEIVSDLAASIASLRELITDEANLGAIKNSIQAFESSIQSFGGILEENRDNLLEITTNIRRSTERADSLIVRAESLIENTDGHIAETRRAIESTLRDFETELGEIQSDFGRLSLEVGETARETTRFMETTREGLEPTLDRLHSVVAHLDGILEGVREGKGTLGQIVTNPSPFVELDRTLRTIRRTILGRDPIEADLPYEEWDPDAAPSR